MNVFLIFLSLFIGLLFRYHPVISIALIIVYVVVSKFIFHQPFKSFLKKFLILLLFFGGGILLSFINLHIDNNGVYKVFVLESKDNYFIATTGLEKYYVYLKDNPYEVGDVLIVKSNVGYINENNIESSFNFKEFLARKGVYYSLSNSHIETSFLTPIRLRAFKDYFLSHFDLNSMTLVKAVLFLNIDDNEIVDNISMLHLAKLLSSSGIYLNLFYRIFLWVFSQFIKEKWAKLISTSFILVYSVFLFPKFSVLRLLLFLILRWINEYLLKEKFSYLTILGISGLFFIIIDYHLTYQSGFILGYSFQIFYYYLSLTLSRFKKKNRIILRYLILFIFIIPIDIYFYHEVSILGYLLSIILTPLFLLFSLLSFITFIGIPLYSLVGHFSNGLINITHYLSYVSFGIYAPNMSDILLVVYYLILTLILLLIDIKFKILLRFVSFLDVLLIVIYLLPIKPLISSEVSFIAVGQGDATLVRRGNTSILIDTGGLTNIDLAKESLIPYFKKKQIYNIDLVITTHNDFDHSGTLASLMNNFHVKQYINEASYFPITINDITFRNYNYFQDQFDDENDKSLVIGFNLFNTDFLIMGDASTKVEKLIIQNKIDIPCNILHVGHHGSNTSTSKEWLDFISPNVAIISCGINNKYHHPHKEVIDLLNKKGIKIRRTDLEGTITYLHYFV